MLPCLSADFCFLFYFICFNTIYLVIFIILVSYLRTWYIGYSSLATLACVVVWWHTALVQQLQTKSVHLPMKRRGIQRSVVVF